MSDTHASRAGGLHGKPRAAAISARALLALSIGVLLVPSARASEPAQAGVRPVLQIKKSAAELGRLDWTACPHEHISQFECATLAVPLDRHGRQQGQVKLAVIRAKATGTPEERIGSVFFNPGGPGGSGLDFFHMVHEQMPPRMRRHYDLVSWDPRGVGRTEPALTGCPMPWMQRPETQDVDWELAFEAHYRTMETANRQCQQANAAYIRHLGTMNVIEDLEALRAAVGDEKLAFAGYSYGTRIGSVYAQVHPERMGPILLDGAVDPTSGIGKFVAEGGRAMDEALGHYFQFAPEAREDVAKAWGILSKAPIPLPDRTVFTRWDFLDTALLAMTFQADMPKIGQLAKKIVRLKDAPPDERAATLETLAQAKSSVGPNTDSGGMFSVVNCLDYADRPDVATLSGIVADNADRGGMFGGSLTGSYAAGCAGFDFEPDPIPLARPTASEHPILIGGATRDSRTPYQWAVQMARAFPNSRMLTYPGGNHVNWFISSACLKSVMDAYFVDGVLPEVDAVCPYAPTLGE